MASFWRPGYDPRRRTLPAIAEDAEEEDATLPTTDAGSSNPHNPDEQARDTSGSAHYESGPARPSAANAGPSGSGSPRHSSTQRQEDDSPPDQEPLTGKERLARRLARNPEFRPRPGIGHAPREVLGMMHVLAEVRGGGVSVLRERIARRVAIASQSAAQQPVRDPGSMSEQLTYENVERFVQLAAAEYQRRFAEEP